MNKQLGVVCIKVEFDVGMYSNNLIQRSGKYREQQKTKDWALWNLKQRHIQVFLSGGSYL